MHMNTYIQVILAPGSRTIARLQAPRRFLGRFEKQKNGGHTLLAKNSAILANLSSHTRTYRPRIEHSTAYDALSVPTAHAQF